MSLSVETLSKDVSAAETGPDQFLTKNVFCSIHSSYKFHSLQLTYMKPIDYCSSTYWLYEERKIMCIE